MMQMTFDEYDNLLEVMGQVKETQTKQPPFWPTEEQISRIMKNKPEKWLELACYIYEYAPAPKDEAERESKRLLSKFINENLELVD